MPSPEQEGLFAIPEVYKPKRPKADPAAVKWAKFTGRQTCDLCIMNVHDGISDTMLSRAKESYTRGEHRWFLCRIHATQVRNGERNLR